MAPSPLATSCGWGVWLCLSPNHEIVRHDLGAILHRIIERCSPFPADIADEIYAHDPIGKSTLSAFKRQSEVQAAILGDGDIDDSEAPRPVNGLSVSLSIQSLG